MSDATLAHHFEDHEQQSLTASLGMWVFLAQEVMFFGGLFLAYVVYRGQFGAGFASGSARLDVALGTANTAVLIASSLTMALAVRSAQLGRRRACALHLWATVALALVFLGVKVVEYRHKWHDALVPGLRFDDESFGVAGVPMFFVLYFCMTGLHALHMIVGLPLIAVVARRALRGRYGPNNHIGVEVLGLYWHFVDIVWIFLFPLLYLVGTHA